jgi:hypothetical protein
LQPVDTFISIDTKLFEGINNYMESKFRRPWHALHVVCVSM